MRILSIDSAAAACAAGIVENGQVLSLLEERMERGQDARLIPLIQEALEEAGLSFSDIDRIAVTRGPGSFTGLRIGLAAARGIGFACEKPVFGIDRFLIHRFQHEHFGCALLVVLDSRRKELYARSFAAAKDSVGPMLMTVRDVALWQEENPDAFIAGDAFELLGGVIDPSRFFPRTEPECITSASLAAAAQEGDPAFLPRPLYVRAPDVTFSPCAREGA